MTEKNLLYKESGQNNLIGMLLAYAAVVVFTLVIGFLYEVFIRIVPIVYINFLLTLGYGASVGVFVLLITRFVKCRNQKSRILLALFAGFVANYFQWVAFFAYIMNMQIPTVNEYFLQIIDCLSPDYFLNFMGLVLKLGVWGFGGSTVNGALLAIVWIVEALLIWGVTIFFILKAPIRPFSELHGKWYLRRIIDHDFEFISTKKIILNKLIENPLQAIQSLEKGDAFRHTQISLFYMENEETQYITVEKVYVDIKNKSRKKTEILVNNFAIETSVAKQILESFPHKKGRIELL